MKTQITKVVHHWSAWMELYGDKFYVHYSNGNCKTYEILTMPATVRKFIDTHTGSEVRTDGGFLVTYTD